MRTGGAGGAPAVGQPSGQIYWSADLTGLTTNGVAAPSAYQAALEAAFDAWESVASVDFERAANAAAADVTVEMDPLAGATVGYASITYSVLPGTDQIIGGSVRFDSLETWDPGTGPETNFYAVALHEIGHILGLQHVNDTSEIMNPVIATETLGDGDVAGARALYGFDAGDTTVAPSTPPPAPAGATPVDGGLAFAPDGAPDAAPPAETVAAAEDDDDGGIFEALFGWIFDLFAAIFGGGDNDDAPAAAVAQAVSTEEGETLLSDIVPVIGVEETSAHFVFYGLDGRGSDLDLGELHPHHDHDDHERDHEDFVLI